MKAIFDTACMVIATYTVVVYGLAATEQFELFLYVGVVLGGMFILSFIIVTIQGALYRRAWRPEIINDSWDGMPFCIGTDFVTRSYVGMYKYDPKQGNFVATDRDPSDDIRITPEQLGIDPNDLP